MNKGVAKGDFLSKFLVLYRSPVSAREQGAGSAIVDLGAPLDGEADVTGFSILQADSRASIDELLADHPHRHTPGGSIDVLEFMALPGMEG